MSNTTIAWWSGGITSAVACRLAFEMYTNVRLVYIETGSHHPDTNRFKSDCEKWYGQSIEVWQSSKYSSHFDVIRKDRFINGPFGARCTRVLKKDIRESVEKEVGFKNQVYGFELERLQINRAIRWQEQYPHTYPLFPLIEKRLSKNECAGIVQTAGITIPEMYKLGYNNNNCVGCVKGGKGYWNKIRKDFPDIFKEMAGLEREIGATCLKTTEGNRLYLDQLSPREGSHTDMIFGECGLFCHVEFGHIMSPRVQSILEGKESVYNL